MPKSRGTALSKHQRKERLGTNKDNTDATYKTIDAHRKKEQMHQTNCLVTISKKTTVAETSFTRAKPFPYF